MTALSVRQRDLKVRFFLKSHFLSLSFSVEFLSK